MNTYIAFIDTWSYKGRSLRLKRNTKRYEIKADTFHQAYDKAWQIGQVSMFWRK